MNTILLTVIFMLGGGQATFTIEFDSMAACEKERIAYLAYLAAAEIQPVTAKCE